jgi:hypothetical protein
MPTWHHPHVVLVLVLLGAHVHSCTGIVSWGIHPRVILRGLLRTLGSPHAHATTRLEVGVGGNLVGPTPNASKLVIRLLLLLLLLLLESWVWLVHHLLLSCHHGSLSGHHGVGLGCRNNHNSYNSYKTCSVGRRNRMKSGEVIVCCAFHSSWEKWLVE